MAKPLRISAAVSFALLFLVFAFSRFSRVISQQSNAPANAIQWRQIGPGGGGNQPTVGVSPSDPNIVIMGSDVGGFFQSTDGGQTWKMSNNTASQSTRPPGYGNQGHFAFDPTPNNSNIVYYGPMKSIDSGATWNIHVDDSQLSSGSGAVDPDHPNVVYIYGYGNVERSSDAWEGMTCMTSSQAPCPPYQTSTTCGGGSPPYKCYQESCIPTPGVNACPNFSDHISRVIIDPKTTSHLIACADSGLYESIDSAQHWTPIAATSPGSPEPLPRVSSGGVACTGLAVYYDSATMNFPALFMTTKTTTAPPSASGWIDIGSWAGGIFKSADLGQTWTSINGTEGANIVQNDTFSLAGGDQYHPAANWNSNGYSAVTLDCNPPVDSGNPTPGCAIRIQSSGILSLGVHSDPLQPVTGGELYEFSAWLYYQKGLETQGTYPVLATIGYYADAEETVPAGWPGNPSEQISIVTYEANPSSPNANFGWRQFGTLLRPPDEARFAKITLGTANRDGSTWIDNVSLRPFNHLPRISGVGQSPLFVSYADLVIDPTDANTIYTGTLIRTATNGLHLADTTGIWKTTDGGANWMHVTRHQWHDNVLDEGKSNPICGDNVCGGRWENNSTCPIDCPLATCGNGQPDSGETSDNCLVDVPFDPDPNITRPYYEADVYVDPMTSKTYYAARLSGEYGVWSMAIGKSQPTGSPTQGHTTVYFGGGHLKTTDGGATWKDVTSTTFLTGPQLQGRGENNDVYTYPVVADTRNGHNWLLYGDTDNRLQLSYDGGDTFTFEGWQWQGDRGPNTQSINLGLADGVTSVILELDPNSPAFASNRIYASVSVQAAAFQRITCCDALKGAALYADYVPGAGTAVGRWAWSLLGSGQGTLLDGPGGIEMIRAKTGDFWASKFGKGIFHLPWNGSPGTWVSTFTGSNWTDSDPNVPMFPANWKTFRMLQEPISERLYVGAGDPTQEGSPGPGETGIWESADAGGSWKRYRSPRRSEP